MIAYALSRVVDPFEAEEIVQDCFLLFWRKRGGLTIIGESALPWLLVTAKYLSLNRIRSSRRSREHRSSKSLDELVLQPDSHQGPEETVLGIEFTREVQSAIEQLDLEDQTVVYLCLVEGLSYAQAARAIGVTHSAVRNRLTRARQTLRTELKTLKGNR